jgi:endo-1,4-beta-D-glucanase Y
VAETEAEDRARTAAERFLDRYVDDDGRVVRHDQGGDTVSEGQAYAMLLAAAIGDRDRFDRVWSWTVEHLRRPDGLLSWHWQDGEVVDAEPAADADLDTARALLLAAERFGEPDYRDDGVAIGWAVLARETVDVAGRAALVAGPWARDGTPHEVNPSYVSPRTYSALAVATGDVRWQALRETGLEHLRALTADGLPPDWAALDESGVRPAESPSGAAPEYGFDALRIPVRFAEDCKADGRAVAADLWPRLRGRDHDHPAEIVAAAAAADAAGSTSARNKLLAGAERRDRDDSTYYGAAWVALGRVMLTTDLLGSC